jgi:hypothetical protein
VADGYASCERSAEVRFVKSELAASFEAPWASKCGRAKKDPKAEIEKWWGVVGPSASCYVRSAT